MNSIPRNNTENKVHINTQSLAKEGTNFDDNDEGLK